MPGAEVISGKVVGVGATITAVTMATGDSNVVRNYEMPAKAYIDNIWNDNGTAGVLRVRSPRLHDNVQGIRFRAGTTVRSLMGDELKQFVYPQDTLTLELSGHATLTDTLNLLMYYEELGGADARLKSWEAIQPRILNVFGFEVALTASATAGDWPAGSNIGSGAVADDLKANVDYAILGYELDTAVSVLAIRGIDTGNLRIGGPGTTEMLETRDWFVRQANGSGRPYIPVINAANKNGTTVLALDNTASTTTNCNLILAELSPGA